MICLETIAVSNYCIVHAEEEGNQQTENSLAIRAPSAVLMEASTGTILYEKDADTPRPPASVTKIMTMLLIFDALEQGKIQLDDEVSVSEYAASMGGSQVFLEPGETQTVDTMLKCISVASANDACGAFKYSRHTVFTGFVACLIFYVAFKYSRHLS